MKTVVAVAFFFALLGGVGMLSVYWAAVTLARSEYLTTATVLALAVFCFAFLAQFAIVKSRHVTARVRYDSAGTLLRPDRTVDVVYQTSLVAVFVAMLLYAIFAPLGRMDIPTPPGLGASYFVFAAVVGVVIGVPSLWMTFCRVGGKGSLRLSPNGFQIRANSSVEAGWHDVEDVTDRRPSGPSTARGLLVIVLADGRAPLLEADAYTPDGKALRDLVRFYWRNPDHRAELTDARASERLRANEF